jgi:predicted nucleic acid-binding protein
VTWVADASVTVAYLLGEASESDRSVFLGDVHAPTLLDVEVTQTLRGLLRGAKIDLETAELGRDELAQLGLRRHPDAHLLRRCWDLRDVCTVYDALYVALTEALDATLVTRDKRLARAVAGIIDVVTG